MSKIQIDTKDILEIKQEYGEHSIAKVILRNYDIRTIYGDIHSNYDSFCNMRDGSFRGGRIPNDIRKPKRYIINKGATILFWEDGTKTIVKRSKDDEYNKRLGFLTAYFQKHSGLTKNQANKYLANLLDENDLNTIVGKMKAKSLQNN